MKYMATLGPMILFLDLLYVQFWLSKFLSQIKSQINKWNEYKHNLFKIKYILRFLGFGFTNYNINN